MCGFVNSLNIGVGGALDPSRGSSVGFLFAFVPGALGVITEMTDSYVIGCRSGYLAP